METQSATAGIPACTLLLLLLLLPLSTEPRWASAAPAGADVLRGAWQQIDGLNPHLGNGLLGFVAGGSTVYSAGLYCATKHLVIFNGAQRCRIAAPDVLRTNVAGGHSTGLNLNLRAGIVVETQTLGSATVRRTFYAHRLRPSVLVQEISIDNSASDAPLTVQLVVNRSEPSADLRLEPVAINRSGTVAFSGAILHPERGAPAAARVAIVGSQIPKNISIRARGQRQIALLASVTTDVSGTDNPLAAAAASFADAEDAWRNASLRAEHEKGWAHLWEQGGVELSGADALAAQVNATFYYLLSSARTGLAFPLGPGGISTNGYWGNAFWDSEVWHMPAFLPFWPELVRAGLDYRLARMTQARAYAASQNYDGLNFPWQTAGVGNQEDLASPANKLEIHVNGGISLLVRRFLDAAGERTSSGAGGLASLAAGIADYFVSRAVPSDNRDGGPLSIKNVVGPDEFGIGFPLYSGVTDSTYTNAAAVQAAQLAADLNPEHPHTGNWTDLARRLTILVSGSGDEAFHPEYQGYPAGNRWFGKKVKQADVTMLQYPLFFGNVSDAVKANDLRVYERVYDPEGPAMTHSIHVVDWLLLGNTAVAGAQLANSTKNMHAPFNVWTESTEARQHKSLKDQGCFNFLTGAGGFAQSIVNGYGGLRFDRSGLLLHPQLPPNATSLRLRAISFAGARFGVWANTTVVRVCALGGAVGFGLQPEGGSGHPQVLAPCGMVAAPWPTLRVSKPHH